MIWYGIEQACFGEWGMFLLRKQRNNSEESIAVQYRGNMAVAARSLTPLDWS